MIRTINSAMCDRCGATITESLSYINQIEISQIPHETIFRATLPYGEISHLCDLCLTGLRKYIKENPNDSN